MKDLSVPTKLYLIFVYLLGLGLFIWNVLKVSASNYLMVVILSVLASLFLIFKVEGTTVRSHYTFSFLIYGFAFAYFGLGETLIVILVSNIVEWAWNNPAWYIQLFNTFCYILVMSAARLAFVLIDPSGTIFSLMGVLSIAVSMGVFTVLNHLIIGIVVWLARGENFKVSGIFDGFPLMMDLTLLTFGAMLNIVWNASPYAMVLFLFPLYLIYTTLRIPSLERKTEIDQKTGLFGHQYFMEHLTKELERSRRFDRPVSVIMLDLDLLRNINNTYGHLAGDEVLIGIAHILKKMVREYDVVARFGGDEFIIMLPETTVPQSFERAEIIRHTIENSEFVVPTSVTPIKVAVSLGVAERESFTQTAEEIIHNADTALYHAKLIGRNKSYAYTYNAFMNSFRNEKNDEPHTQNRTGNEPQDQTIPAATPDYATEGTRFDPARTESMNAGTANKVKESSQPLPRRPNRFFQPVTIYIGGLALLAVLFSYGLYLFAPVLYHLNWLEVWPGILISVLLVIFTELYSIDLFLGKTSLSTSAVPMLAGTLLFGPLAGIILSITYAIVVGIKYHSKFNKYIFNLSNQVIAAMVYTFALRLLGQPLGSFSIVMQCGFIVLSALIVYSLNTWMISFGMGLDLRQPPIQIWKEQYRWLITIYMGMGLIATAYIFGYRMEGVIGTLLMMVPLLLLRISQKQYVDRTREAVKELREKNIDLERSAAEISQLNDGLLYTLAEIIDLRDPFVLGHSKRVTTYAVMLAEKMGLNQKQVKLIHKASLLHDIGKLGISMKILEKPSKLTPEEYENVKKHATLGGNLIKISPSLLSLEPIVRNHHEYYNGQGYPDKLSENQISIEARIVSVADAMEAMTSDRPYRKKLEPKLVIEELKNGSGSQFDPLVVQAALQILEKEFAEAGSKPENKHKASNKINVDTVLIEDGRLD